MNWIVAAEQIPQAMGALDDRRSTCRRAMFLLMVNLLFLVLGAFLDTLLMLLIIVPMLMPTVHRARHRPGAFRRRRRSST